MNKTEQFTIFLFIDSMSGGGAERYVLEIINQLKNKNYRVILGLLKKQGELLGEIPEEIIIEDLSDVTGWYSTFKARSHLLKLYRKYDPDIIFSTLTAANCLVLRTRLFFKTDQKFIINVRTNLSEEIQKRGPFSAGIKKTEIRLLYRRADIILTASKGIEQNLIRKFGLSPKKIETIYTFIDMDHVLELAKKRITLPWNGIRKKLKLIVASGRLVPQKGFLDAIKCFEIVYKQDASFRMIILGDGPLKEQLQQTINEKRLGEFIKLTGFVKNPYPYYQKAKYFISTSYWEGILRAHIEAKMCGSVPILYDCEFGPSESITHNQDGILVPTGDFKSMSETILALEKNTSHYELLQSNRNFSKFDKTAIENKLKDIFSPLTSIKN